MNDLIKLGIGSLVRHVLGGLGGALIAIGVSESATSSFLVASEPVLAGVLLWGVAQVWSFVQKKKSL